MKKVKVIWIKLRKYEESQGNMKKVREIWIKLRKYQKLKVIWRKLKAGEKSWGKIEKSWSMWLDIADIATKLKKKIEKIEKKCDWILQLDTKLKKKTTSEM